MAKDFNLFMSQLKETNQTLSFYCDFDKISHNVDDVKLSLCMLNSLIGENDMQKAVETIWKRDKSAFNVLEILIAVRIGSRNKIMKALDNCISIDTFFTSVEGVLEFLNGTGLTKILQERRVNDLVDYVFGIETGLDSNARKNRGGHVMEELVADIFDAYNVNYRREVYSDEWKEISHVLGKDKKRFDFVIDTDKKTYLIEVNFYSSSGSKLNEVARSYSDLAPKINSVKGFEFVWITDGIGWNKARNKLQEAYNLIPSVFNLTNIKTDFLDTL